MRPYEAFKDTKMLCKIAKEEFMFPRENLEPISTRESTKRVITILDAEYEKADLSAIVTENCDHLSSLEQVKLLTMLQRHEILFDGTLGDFQTDPVHFNLQLGTKP